MALPAQSHGAAVAAVKAEGAGGEGGTGPEKDPCLPLKQDAAGKDGAGKCDRLKDEFRSELHFPGSICRAVDGAEGRSTIQIGIWSSEDWGIE